MNRPTRCALALLALGLAAPAFAEDAEGCKDHPLFNRMPGYSIRECDHTDFDAKKFPVGAADPEDGNKAKSVEVEGAFTYLVYSLDEGARKASGLQVMRNFQNAAKAAGGSVEAEYRDWCVAMIEADERLGNGCTNWGTTLKLTKGGKEIWTYVQLADENTYAMQIVEREAMKQAIAVNELVDKITKDGFIALYINFDTGKATIKPDSTKTLDDVAAALKTAPDLKLEVGGHTDNVGAADANQKLSEERAKAVMTALVARGVAAARLTAKGYGQSAPVADNRSEDGRAKNRRVELTKK